MNYDANVIPQLFRSEFSKMVAVLVKRFGLDYIETAEDIISETFLSATETWQVKGMPDDPKAWLYAVARYKVSHYFKRKKIYQEKVAPEITDPKEGHSLLDADFLPQNIKDSQLQMMFVVCNPIIGSEAQIGLALRILCGFGIDEIAKAFFTNKETINKRLFRAKEKLQSAKIGLEVPDDSRIINRLDNVLHIIYLLFNEGYFSITGNQTLRKDFCLEALRLGVLLTEFKSTNLPKTNALVALMCYHSSRFGARHGTNNNISVLLDDQDRQLWDRELINYGHKFLIRSAQGNELSSYHVEARIAYCHAEIENDTEKWRQVLEGYDQLLKINNSPGVALNRIFSLYKVNGAKTALHELEKLKVPQDIFYHTLLAELYTSIDPVQSKRHLACALKFAKTENDKTVLQKKLKLLEFLHIGDIGY